MNMFECLCACMRARVRACLLLNDWIQSCGTVEIKTGLNRRYVLVDTF